MFRHSGAAAVVPVLGGDDSDPQILLINQYRYAAQGQLWEIPAGRLDKDEEPMACARRELLEETGTTAGRIEPLIPIYPTPGFCDEQIHLFAAFDLAVDEKNARREADEFITVKAFPVSQVLGMIRDGTISDAKTICGVLFFAGFRLGV